MRGSALLLAIGLLAACGGDDGGDPAEVAGASGTREHDTPKLLVIGWDGAPWSLLDPLRVQGKLPNLQRLVASGRTAVLESTVVPISSAAWIGATTGKHPGNSGVYSFFDPVPGSYEVELVSAASSEATPIWRILARHGLPSIVFGVPLTYPPEPVPGVMVAGMLAPLQADYAWPPGYADELRGRGFVPDLDVWRDNQELSMPRMYEQVELKRDILVELLEGEDWQFAMIVFKSFDVLGHRAFDLRPEGVSSQLAQHLDKVLGELIAAAGDDVNVVLMSDHGFATYERAFFPHAWLLENGFAHRRPDARPVPPMNAPLSERLAEEHMQRIRELDLPRTRALVGVSEGNFGSVRLNLQGREPQGSVDPGDASAVLAEIEARLRATKVQGTQQPLVRRVWRREELYPGPHVDQLPDLLFEVDASVVVYPWSTPASQNRANPPMPDHARDGVWVASGPSIAPSGVRERASIFDLAPTALHLLGLPVYAEMDGEARVDWLREPRELRSLREADDPHAADSPWTGPLPFSEAEREEVKARLAELGYTE